MKRRILARLRELCDRQQPGQSFTQTEIADACGCRRQWIGQIESAAMNKFRERMLARHGNLLDEIRDR